MKEIENNEIERISIEIINGSEKKTKSHYIKCIHTVYRTIIDRLPARVMQIVIIRFFANQSIASSVCVRENQH